MPISETGGFEEILSETEGAEQDTDEGPAKERGRRRRRRRRGGRKPSDSSGTAPVTGADDISTEEESDEDAISLPDTDEASGADVDREKAEGDADERHPRRRRRRRGGKKRRPEREASASGEVVEAGALSDSEAVDDELEQDEADFDESEVGDAEPRLPRAGRAEAVADEEAGVDEEADADEEDSDDEDEDAKGMKGHRGIPSWDEAVGYIITVNMESRAKNPHAGSSGPRGRGGRGGGPHRGRGRPSGS